MKKTPILVFAFLHSIGNQREGQPQLFCKKAFQAKRD